MTSQTKKTFPDIFHLWQIEDKELEETIDKVRDWMREVAEYGIPHFGEAATRLRPLRERMLVHFAREDDLVRQLADLYPATSPEVDAVRRQAVQDHDQLCQRLDDLLDRLDQTLALRCERTYRARRPQPGLVWRGRRRSRPGRRRFGCYTAVRQIERQHPAGCLLGRQPAYRELPLSRTARQRRIHVVV